MSTRKDRSLVACFLCYVFCSACESSIGTQDSQEEFGNSSQSASCVESTRELAIYEESSLGVSPAEVMGRVTLGSSSSLLVWAQEGTDTVLHIDAAYDGGSSRLIERNEHPESANSFGNDSQPCFSRVEVDVRVQMRSEDGRIDAEFLAPLHVMEGDEDAAPVATWGFYLPTRDDRDAEIFEDTHRVVTLTGTFDLGAISVAGRPWNTWTESRVGIAMSFEGQGEIFLNSFDEDLSAPVPSSSFTATAVATWMHL